MLVAGSANKLYSTGSHPSFSRVNKRTLGQGCLCDNQAGTAKDSAYLNEMAQFFGMAPILKFNTKSRVSREAWSLRLNLMDDWPASSSCPNLFISRTHPLVISLSQHQYFLSEFNFYHNYGSGI